MLCKLNGSDESHKKNKMSATQAMQWLEVDMRPIIVCVFCISASLLTVSRTLLVVNAGANKFLEYINGSMGSKTTGMVSNNREEVWLYKYSWPDKNKVKKK